MNDSELRGIILEKFYEVRHNGPSLVNPLTLPGLDLIEQDHNRLFNICEHLAEHGPLRWESLKGLTTIGGMGQISACGVDVVEGTARSPITVILHDQRISISQSSNVQVGNSNTISQTTGMPLGDLTKLVTEIASHLDQLGLDARQKQRAAAQIATLKTELSGDPDPEIVKQALRTLRNITEGAIGSLLATAMQPGVWHSIQKALNSSS